MTRTRAAVLLTTLLLVGGCSADDADADAAKSSPPSPVPSSSTTSEPGATPAPDPIRFRHHTTGRECQEIGGRLMEYEMMTVRRPVTLDGLELGASRGVRTGMVYIAERPQGAIVTTGGAIGAAPGHGDWDTTNWRSRVPLEGATVTPGDWYLFVPLTIRNPAAFDSVDISWSDDAGSGTSSWPLEERYRRHCS